jgi:superfamily II DNA/RNA helicase
LQILILTPTREIAAQVGDVLTNIGQGFSGENFCLYKATHDLFTFEHQV